MIAIMQDGRRVGRVSGASALAIWLHGRSPDEFTYADHLGESIDQGDVCEALGLKKRIRLREAAPASDISERKFEMLMQDLRDVRNSAAGIVQAMDEQRLAEVWDALMSIFEICGGDPDVWAR